MKPTTEINSDTLKICREQGYDWHVIDGVVYPIEPKEEKERGH